MRKVQDLKRGDGVRILYRDSIVLDVRKLPTGDYEIWWKYNRQNGKGVDYGLATFTAGTTFDNVGEDED
jgi:hypothetical protein